MSNLADKNCVENDKKVEGGDIAHYMAQLNNEWELIDQAFIRRVFFISDYKKALNFVKEVGKIADIQEHHPEIFFTFGFVNIAVSSNGNGVYMNDFVLAAKIDRCFNQGSFKGTSGAVEHQ